MRRAAPAGRQVAVGRLRVDAARAVAKLREYQLAEPAAWILEAIRAAVASGSTRIELQGDSNDIWLGWHGPEWSREQLPNLLSELVSPQSAEGGQELRLLATAINTALGLPTSYLDLYGTQDGHSVKVRYSPSLLKVSDEPGVASTLAELEVEDVEMPAMAEGCAIFLHLRRRMGLDPLRNLLRGESPELDIAREACANLSIPITIGDTEFGAHCEQGDLLRVDIEHGIDGFLALTKADPEGPPAQPQMQVAELGVLICTYELETGAEEALSPVPLRFYVNAERMPTNASHSSVRRNEHPIRSAEKQLPDLFETLCNELHTKLTKNCGAGPLRDAVVALLAASAAQERWHRLQGLPRELLELAKLPLLRNAVGTPRSFLDFWRGNTAHTGEVPLSADYERWLKQTLWAPPGSVDARLLGTVDASILTRLLQAARKELKARKAFMRNEPRSANFDRLPKHTLVRAPIDMKWAQLVRRHVEGEICLLAHGKGGRIIVLFEEREIEELDVPCELAFMAIVAAKGLTPASDYKSVLKQSSLPYAAMIASVQSAAIACVEKLCVEGADSALLKQLVPKALVSLTKLATERLTGVTSSPLAEVAMWPLLGGGHATLNELYAESVVGIATFTSSDVAPANRLTVYCDSLWQKTLLRRTLHSRQVKTVAYAWPVSEAPDERAQKLAIEMGTARSRSIVLAVVEKECRGAVGWRDGSVQLRRYHCGRELYSTSFVESVTPISVFIDSDNLVPNEDWDSVQGAVYPSDYQHWEDKLLRAVTLSILGRPPAELLARPLGFHTNYFLRRRMAEAIARLSDPAETLGDELFEELRNAPLFTLLGRARVSAVQLAAKFPETIACLEPMQLPQSDHGSWKPLVAEHWVALMAGRLADRKVEDVASELATREAVHGRLERIEKHRQQPKLSLDSTFAKSSTITSISGADYDMRVAMHRVLKPAELKLTLHMEGRPFQFVQQPHVLPLIAAVDLDISQSDTDFLKVDSELLRQIVEDLTTCGGEIAEAELHAGSGSLATDTRLVEFLQYWLVFDKNRPNFAKIRKRLCGLVRFADQSGEMRSLKSFVDESLSKTGVVRMTTYSEAWLSPLDDETQQVLDKPLIILPLLRRLEMARLRTVLRELISPRTLVDVTDAVQAMQLRRKVKRGIVANLSVSGDSKLKRRVSVLLENDSIGEIAFIDAQHSRARVFRDGVETETFEYSAPLAVEVALEYRDYQGAGQFSAAEVPRQHIEDLTTLLLRAVLAASDLELPEWLCRKLRRALLGGNLETRGLPKLAHYRLFNTTRGEDVSWMQIERQAERFMMVWYSNAADERLPLNTEHIVLALHADELPVEFSDTISFVNAEEKLSIDARARWNRDRPTVESIALSREQEQSALTSVELEGAGEATGIVAPLLPGTVMKRGVQTFRSLKPLGNAFDPCSWPTLSIVDDPGIVPNRTWNGPEHDEHWKELCAAIEKTSDAALAQHLSAPENALHSIWIGSRFFASLPGHLRKHNTVAGLCVRGRLWLAASTGPGTVKVRGTTSSSALHPQDGQGTSAHILPVHGELLVNREIGGNSEKLVRDIILEVYRHLLVGLASLEGTNADHKAAHLAFGLAMKNLKPLHARGVRFACFAPHPCSAEQLEALFESKRAVPLIDDPAQYMGQGPALVDDDSVLSRTLVRLLHSKLEVYTESAEEVYDGSFEAMEVAEAQLNIRPPHVLSPLAHDLHSRLSQMGLGPHAISEVRIETGRKKPMLLLEEHDLVLAGDNPLLLALRANRLEQGSGNSVALDLLSAHALTVLNQSYSIVTDATHQGALRTLLSLGTVS